MKSRDGKSQRREEKRKSEKKEDPGAKSRNTVFSMFFQWFEGPEGRKVGSLKRRVRSQLARWEMKNCTPFWREAHFQVTFTFMSCALHAHKGNSAHLSRYRTKIKMKNEYGATKPLRRSQGQDGKLQPKILLRQNHQKSQWQLRQLACFFGVFSYGCGNTSQLPGKAIWQVYSSRVPSTCWGCGPVYPAVAYRLL